jgi:hypothetical protein
MRGIDILIWLHAGRGISQTTQSVSRENINRESAYGGVWIVVTLI